MSTYAEFSRAIQQVQEDQQRRYEPLHRIRAERDEAMRKVLEFGASRRYAIEEAIRLSKRPLARWGSL